VPQREEKKKKKRGGEENNNNKNQKKEEVKVYVLREGNMLLAMLDNSLKEGVTVVPNFDFKGKNVVSGRHDRSFSVNDRNVQFGEKRIIMEVMQAEDGAWSTGFAGNYKLLTK